MEAVARINEAVPSASVSGGDNREVAEQSGKIVVAVPFEAVAATIPPIQSALDGKLVISVVAALTWEGGRPHPVVVEAGSVAQLIQGLLPEARVTSAFHTLSAEILGQPSQTLDEDTIVCGDDREARHATMELARKIEGIRPISGGRLENSVYPEILVGLLAAVNRIHKVHAGVRFTGLKS